MDLNRATTFVRVVETGGFTRAAETLGLPPSSVSRSVARLEDELGVTLLERTTRKVMLTDAGRAFFERAREALAGLAEASELAHDAAREAHGVVRVAIPPDTGATIGPVFGPFLLLHPRIRAELTFTARGHELVGDLVDLAIVSGKLPDSALVAHKLGSGTARFFAAPAYLAARGTPRTLAELAKHDAVLMRAVGGEARWEVTGPRGAEHVDVSGRLVADHLQLVVDAATSGLGIALLPVFVGERAAARGELVSLLPRYSQASALHLVAHAGRHLPRRVALLRDYLVEALSGRCKEHERA